ncbi:MAG: hypothetical protein RSC68_07905, partial [Acinetobacter sp.]
RLLIKSATCCFYSKLNIVSPRFGAYNKQFGTLPGRADRVQTSVGRGQLSATFSAHPSRHE